MSNKSASISKAQLLVAVKFPAFADGRGLSLGVLLRTRYGFKGELRAFGDILPDLAQYLHRSGFDAFVVENRRAAEVAHSLRRLRHGPLPSIRPTAGSPHSAGFTRVAEPSRKPMASRLRRMLVRLRDGILT